MELRGGTKNTGTGGGISTVTDGTTTVTSATTLTIVGGTVSNLGGGNAQVTFTGGAGTPGGLNTQLQYNNSGVFGGISGAVTDGTTVSLTAPHLLNPTINGIGVGLATLVYPNTATNATITVPATTGTLALTSQLTAGTVTSVATDSTLTGGPITATGTLGLNLANSNTWTANQSIQSTSANAFAVGANGSTNPGFVVDDSTASAATGISIQSLASGGGANLNVISPATNEALRISAKGSGVINIGSNSTGNIFMIHSTVFSTMAQINGASATALNVLPGGTGIATFNIDSSAASVATGLNIKGAAAAGGLAISVLSSGTNEGMSINAKGSGNIVLANISTGNVGIGNGTGASTPSTLIYASQSNGGGTGYTTATIKNTSSGGRAELALGTDDGDFSGFVAMAGSATSNQARQFDIGSSVNGNMGLWTNNTQWGTIDNTGRFGIGSNQPAPTAKVHIAAGTAAVGTAPLKLTSGTNLTTTEAGAIEYNGTHLYFTAANGGTRFQLDQQSGSGTVTSIVAGTGLTGGTITTTGTVALDLTRANTWSGKQTIQLTSGDQLQLGYDASNYLHFDTVSSGVSTIDVVAGTTRQLNLLDTSDGNIAIKGTGGSSQGEFAMFYLTESTPRIAMGRDLIGNGLPSLIFKPTSGGTFANSGSGFGSPTAGNLSFYTTNGSAFTQRLNIDGSGNIQIVNKVTKYNNITATGWGIPAIYGTGRITAQTAAATIATYTVGASDGSFYISANVLVTTSTLHTFTVTVSYTDEGNTARVVTLQFSNLAGTFVTAIANAAGAVPYEGVPLHIRCKASTAITIATAAGGTYTTVTYNAEGSITQIA